MRRALVTGSAGFIGFHLSSLLLSEGFAVHGFDGMTDYYDVTLKQRRRAILLDQPGFSMTEARLEEPGRLRVAVEEFRPDVIVHLAAQAGVRHSFSDPRAYIDSNIVGSFEVLQAAREFPVSHLLIASTSSAYGANDKMPFKETDKADTQISIYAATKKAVESLAHSYAHLFGIPTTMFRFFTVYGPWGRPDMAYFKFVDAILNDQPIEIFNHGDMERDFTYIDDLVRAIRLLFETPPPSPASRGKPVQGDSLSPVASYRLVNIGNSEKVRLLDFIDAIEEALGKKAIRKYVAIQPGDVSATWADAALLQELTGYRPLTGFREGVDSFVRWHRGYYTL